MIEAKGLRVSAHGFGRAIIEVEGLSKHYGDVRAVDDVSFTVAEGETGEVYVCADCGLQIQVLKSCADSAEGACSCAEPLSCCGEPLALKK